MSIVSGIPEISVYEVEQKLKSGEEFVLLDVREEAELALARIADERVCHVPLSRLAVEGITALPLETQVRDAEIVVFCHHGVRSADVTGWLLQQDWKHVRSMAGGIDLYARRVDPAIGRY
ncbi:MAG: hypothetical protein OHK0052_24170 [Anaerolineales bacterium]